MAPWFECRITIGTQKGTLILATTHISGAAPNPKPRVVSGSRGLGSRLKIRASGLVEPFCTCCLVCLWSPTPLSYSRIYINFYIYIYIYTGMLHTCVYIYIHVMHTTYLRMYACVYTYMYIVHTCLLCVCVCSYMRFVVIVVILLGVLLLLRLPLPVTKIHYHYYYYYYHYR